MDEICMLKKIPCGCSDVVCTAPLLSLPSLMSSVLESSTSSSPEPSSMGSLDGGRDGRTVILKDVLRFFSGSMIGSSHCYKKEEMGKADQFYSGVPNSNARFRSFEKGINYYYQSRRCYGGTVAAC